MGSPIPLQDRCLGAFHYFHIFPFLPSIPVFSDHKTGHTRFRARGEYCSRSSFRPDLAYGSAPGKGTGQAIGLRRWECDVASTA